MQIFVSAIASGHVGELRQPNPLLRTHSHCLLTPRRRLALNRGTPAAGKCGARGGKSRRRWQGVALGEGA